MAEDLFVSGMLAAALIATAYVVSLGQGRLYAVGSSLFGLITANEAGRVWSGDLGIVFFAFALALAAGLLLRVAVRKRAILLALMAAFAPPFLNAIQGHAVTQQAGAWPEVVFPFPAVSIAGLLGLSLVVLGARDRSGLTQTISQDREDSTPFPNKASGSETGEPGAGSYAFERDGSAFSLRPAQPPQAASHPPSAAAGAQQHAHGKAETIRRVQTKYWMALALGASIIAVIAVLGLIGFVAVGEPFVQNTISALFLIAAALAMASAWSTIRDRDRLVEAVHRQTDLNRRLSDTSRSGVFAVDKDLRVTMWNPALARCTGLSESSMLGTRLSEDCPLISEPASRNCLLWAVGGLEMMCRGIPFQPSSGRPGGCFDAYYTPIFGSGDQPRGAVGIIHVNSEGFDVEERKDRHGRKASSGAFGYGDS